MATPENQYCQDFYIFYGAKRIRTADPLNAIEVLYQLSYNPVSAFTIMAKILNKVKGLKNKIFNKQDFKKGGCWLGLSSPDSDPSGSTPPRLKRRLRKPASLPASKKTLVVQTPLALNGATRRPAPRRILE